MSALRWTLLAIAVVVAMVAASLTAAPNQWRQAVDWAEQRYLLLQTTASSCPVLVDASIPSASRPLYEDAARLGATIDSATAQELRSLAAGDVPRASASAAIDALEQVPVKALQLLEQATRADEATFDFSVIGERHSSSLPFSDLMPLCDALIVRARYVDRDQDRLQAWLSSVACGIDMAGGEVPVMAAIGCIIVGRTAQAATGDWLQSLSPESLATLQQALALADAALPVETPLVNGVVHYVLLLDRNESIEPGEVGFASRLQTWGHGFSVWHAAADRVVRAFEAVQAFEQATPEHEPWSLRRRRLSELVAQEGRCNGDLFGGGFLNHTLEFAELRRDAVTRLRLLRLAVAYLLADELPRLADPLGDGQIRVEVDGDRLHCASSGDGLQLTVLR